jgi:ubiquinone/menaquinone biosynthesis C-methylase UbiE
VSLARANFGQRFRWTIWAAFYDRLISFDAQRERSIRLAAIQPGEGVLIVGCGTGRDLDYIPHGAYITATDLTPAMTRRAVARAKRLGVPARVMVMDGHLLLFDDATFDVVILHLILAVIPDPEACLREAARVLRPGGRVAVFDKFLQPGRKPSLKRKLANVLSRWIATHLNRQLEPLVAASGLCIVADEPALLGDLFRIVLLRKPSNPLAPRSTG